MLDNSALKVHNLAHPKGCVFPNFGMRVMKYLYLILTVLFITACTAQNKIANALGSGYMFRPEKLFTPVKDAVSDGYWDKPSGLSGEHVIVVDTRLQQAKYYIGGRQVGLSDISSGRAGHGTPQGTFSIIAKDIDHKSSSYGSIVDSAGNTLVESYTVGEPIPAGGRYKGAEMNFGMQITTSGIWMHEGVVTSAPESHGCIRLPRKMAKIFYENTPIGSKVIIK